MDNYTINYISKIQSVIKKFNLDLYWDNSMNCIETSAFIKIKMKTRGMIKDITKYENEFKSVVGDDTWLEARNDYISICIPKTIPDKYPLNEILESDFYYNYPGILKIALGETPSGEMVIGDLEKWINVLIAGIPNSGKSTLLNVIINCLIQQDSNDLKLIIMDLKKVELTQYNCVPHLLKPVITNVESAHKGLISLISEMFRRYDLLEDAGVKNIQKYNINNHMPYLVVIIDELSVLMLDDKKEMCETQLIKLASLGRAAGIHLILATQKPSSNIITTDIKSNIDTRISFKVTNHYDSQVILDESGAEKLRMNGDMYLRDGDGLERIQCCFIEDEEIESFKNNHQFKPVIFGKVEVPIIQKQLEYIKVVEVEETEFERLYKESVNYVNVNKECNQFQLRNLLHKGPAFVDKILEKLINDKIITKNKKGKVYQIFKGDF